jgi:hypothetical protein
MKTAGKVIIVALLIWVILTAVYIVRAPYPSPPPPMNLMVLISVFLAIAVVFASGWYRRSHGSKPPPPPDHPSPK